MQQIDPDAPIPVPFTPPTSWFYEVPEWWDPDGALIQLQLSGPETGRVCALVAPWGECVMDGKEGCFTAPPSPTGYEYAHPGTTLTGDGEPVRTANIGGNVNHAALQWGLQAAVDHYANTATRSMRGRYVDHPDGILFVGALWPGLKYGDALTIVGSALSGDWRWVQTLRAYDMTGSQLVNNPAFRPVPKKSGSRYAVAASLATVDGVGLPEVILGDWSSNDGVRYATDEQMSPARELLRRIQTVEPVTYDYMMGQVDDVVLEDPFEDADIDEIQKRAFGCPKCGCKGCDACGHTGYQAATDDDDWGYDIDEFPPELIGDH